MQRDSCGVSAEWSQRVQGPGFAPEVLEGGKSVVFDGNGRTRERLTLWCEVKARIFFIEWTKSLE